LSIYQRYPDISKKQLKKIKFNEIILNNCWHGGSEEIKTDNGLFFGVSGKITELIQVNDAELVKL
jgi:hypothetical protein